MALKSLHHQKNPKQSTSLAGYILIYIHNIHSFLVNVSRVADTAACPGHPLRAEIKPMQHFTVEATGERLQELEMENLEETSFWFKNKSFMMIITHNEPFVCVILAVLHCGVGHENKVWVNRKIG